MARGPAIVTSVGGARGSEACAAQLAVAAAAGGPALLVELGASKPARPAVLATAQARELEGRIASVVGTAAARGALCITGLPGGQEGIAAAGVALREAGERVPVVVWTTERDFRDAVEDPGLGAAAALLRADVRRDRSLASLLVTDLHRRGLAVRVAKAAPDWLTARRCRAGSGGSGAPGLFGPILRRMGSERGQAVPAVVGAIGAVMLLVLALAAIAGGLTGKGRAQRAVDLAAVSAVRSMRDDLPRLLAPAVLASGEINPRHLSKPVYLARARAAAERAAEANGLPSRDLRMKFPDGASFAPVQAQAIAWATASGSRTRVSATAEAAAPASATGGLPAYATGGGYSGPLVYRTGEGMRPDVAASFDEMAAAAAQDGVVLSVVSGFRSDAEQAALFAAHPDPRWVAPPGQSLHRCATELDLGPSGAYSWLAANASRFGFVQRYSWEAWHYGFDAGAAPCSEAGNHVLGSGSDGAGAGSDSLPAFVPHEFRDMILEAAGRWNVSAALLAAQEWAESGFDPTAGSPAGAQGIAQFMPSTAAAYGLTDPYDPRAAIDAQAHLMSDLLGQFGSPALALAAYNAGPAPVQACGCVPAYPETTAYVAKILAAVGGAGGLLAPELEVRLIE